jgi:hypothetical protein
MVDAQPNRRTERLKPTATRFKVQTPRFKRLDTIRYANGVNRWHTLVRSGRDEFQSLASTLRLD